MMREHAKQQSAMAAGRRLINALTLGLLLLPLVASLAQAQRRQPKVIQLEEIKIEGRVQKPNAFYILNRSNIGYEVMDLRTSFLHQVVMAVQQEPF